MDAYTPEQNMPRPAGPLTRPEGGQLQGRHSMRGRVIGLMACAMLLVLGACQASATPQNPGSPAAGVESPAATITPTIETSSPSEAPSPSCDPVDELFANMFAGLSEAALSNASIAPEEFIAALANDRQAVKRYFEALGLPADDASIDAAMSADLGQRLFRQALDGGSPAPSGGPWVVCGD
jgi:hypothetical protein